MPHNVNAHAESAVNQKIKKRSSVTHRAIMALLANNPQSDSLINLDLV